MSVANSEILTATQELRLTFTFSAVDIKMGKALLAFSSLDPQLKLDILPVLAPLQQQLYLLFDSVMDKGELIFDELVPLFGLSSQAIIRRCLLLWLSGFPVEVTDTKVIYKDKG